MRYGIIKKYMDILNTYVLKYDYYIEGIIDFEVNNLRKDKENCVLPNGRIMCRTMSNHIQIVRWSTFETQ